ncbi:MAG: BlaI/MecI/CopY family transcriptional regulator [Flavobacteriales bacterium]|nr:BlaI/MecI/CopY family transcriptional regulator [Flavobacteriales bacterium]
MQALTRAEEQLMLILWKLGSGLTQEVREELPEPRVTYNTVSSTLRILVKKGVLEAQPEARNHRYVPLFSKDDYARYLLGHLLENYCDNALQNLLALCVNGSLPLASPKKKKKKKSKKKKRKGE